VRGEGLVDVAGVVDGVEEPHAARIKPSARKPTMNNLCVFMYSFSRFFRNGIHKSEKRYVQTSLVRLLQQ
jgi:hypothetical protein